jgi:hypothetical protein
LGGARPLTRVKKLTFPGGPGPLVGVCGRLKVCELVGIKKGKAMEIVLINVAAAVIYGMIAFNSMREGRQAPPRAEEQ